MTPTARSVVQKKWFGLVLLCAAACASTRSPSSAPSDAPASVAYGYESALDAHAGIVVRDAAEWERVWKRHHARVLPVPPSPAVDFVHEMVLGITLGPRPTGGYGVRIRAARVQGRRLVVDVAESAPPTGAIVPMVVTHPYAFVRVPRFDGEVLFERR
jgi:hypothetical protein